MKKRTKPLTLWLLPEEKERITKEAQREGLETSTWARRIILGKLEEINHTYGRED